jgi:uncharacterized protein (TIGR00369 family)
MDTLIDNLTRAHIATAIAEGRRNVPLDTNPVSQNLAMTLLEGEPGELQLGFVAPLSSTQGNSVVGGGTLASMLDLAMAMAVLSVLPPGRTCATISLSVNMMASAQAGPLKAKASIERVGRNIGFAHASLFDASGTRLLASGTSSLALFDERPPAGE